MGIARRVRGAVRRSIGSARRADRLPFERYGRAIREIGIGFLFAQAAHKSTRHAAPARKQVGARTVFNLLGPLTNPAGAQSQVLGVFSEDVIDVVAATLVELGVRARVCGARCGRAG